MLRDSVQARFGEKLAAIFVTAMRHGLGPNKILGTIHVYPTLTETNKYASRMWKRAQVTRDQNDFLAAYQAWDRDHGALAIVL